MTEQERLAAALAYQQAYQQAQQPAMMNPNLARQGARGRENMMPPTSIMDERYPAFKRNQEDVEKLMLGLDIVGSAIPLAGPAMKGAKVLGQHAAPQLAQALENYTFKTGMALPIDVYHGSPHRFAATAKNPLGEFDPTKIGSGEGAQAYGYGHYLAENPAIAKSYKEALTKNTGIWDANVNGQSLYDAASNYGSTGYAKTFAEKYFDLVKNGKTENQAKQQISSQLQKRIALAKSPGDVKGAQEALDFIQNSKITMPIGSLYKVDLPDEVVPRMLDWDKPLSQQNEAIQKVFPHFSSPEARALTLEGRQLRQQANDLFSAGKLEEAKSVMNRAVATEARMLGAMGRDEMTGQDLHGKIASLLGNSAKEIGPGAYDFGSKTAAEMLREMGIPGIQYLDAGSRRAGTGTRNFVVFPGNEGLLNILGRE